MTTRDAAAKFYSLTRIAPKFDGILSVATGRLTVDIFDLDKKLAAADPEYDSENCTYKGKPDYSMEMYLREKWGEQASMLCDIMCTIKV